MKFGIETSSFLALLAATPNIFSIHVHAEQTNAPSTSFGAQNFTIAEPKVTFNDPGGDNFELLFEYTIGKSTESSSLTLFQEDCKNTNNVSDILSYIPGGDSPVVSKSVKDAYQNYTVSIDKKKIGESLIVKDTVGDSKGTLEFCAMIEGKAQFGSGLMSVSFRKTKVQLDFDLTTNTFIVTDNGIIANTIDQTSTSVDTAYGVDAFRCGTGDSEYVDIGTSGILTQNALVGICVKPDKNEVEVSSFEMLFRQNNATVYTAATHTSSGPKAGPLSLHSKSLDGNTHRIVSRLVTNLFNNGGEEFSVTGNAYLQFISSDSSPTPEPCAKVTRDIDCNNNEENYYMKDDGNFYISSLPENESTSCCHSLAWKYAPGMEGEFCTYNERNDRTVFRGNCLQAPPSNPIPGSCALVKKPDDCNNDEANYYKKDGEYHELFLPVRSELWDGSYCHFIEADNGRYGRQVYRGDCLQVQSTRNLRMLEDSSKGSAGESSFSLYMEIKKTTGTGDSVQMKNNIFSFSLIGAAVAVIIGFVVYKKLG